MEEARTQSVLHALINLARDTSYACCRCMLENSLFTHLKILWKDVPESSELCLEIGWLTACVYNREETFLEHADQYWAVLNFVTGKLLHFSLLPDSDWKEKVMTPCLVCCGNMLGLSPEITLVASDLPPFLPAVKACLSSRSDIILRHTVWVLTNFTAEPSCRVMVICHSDLRTKLFALCTQQNWEIVAEVLHLLEGMVRVSSEMNQLLVKQGVLGYLNNLLNHPSSGIVEQALGILEALLVDLKSLEQPSVFQAVQNLTIASFDNKLVERARALKEYLLSQSNNYS
ncbi:importin subunit alpha [Plakobranchus ocellatus]|uniref:Importin subunit alpha n=1 Tax=Plakobranchus ocellatus TaxID=259542 RepID=A0AAV3ZY16_9GAST|nr:importin subunit alpha [Plakobranchus ocellatus]